MPVLTVAQWVLYLLLSVSLIMLFSLSCNLLGLSIAFLRSRRTVPGYRSAAEIVTIPVLDGVEYPRVLVQLPAFNEGMLIERAIRAAALDWPRDRLTIQVLDDSTDGSEVISQRIADELRRTGVEISVIHRRDRAGFKAGALANGLLRDDSPYIVIFDADFVPPADFLKRTVPVLMADRELAFVQARWEHLNARENLLTRAQAVMLDAHFGVEQCVRSATGMVLPFNGTCGVWRRDAIDDAGGWTADTLTEDLDLSVRAHLAGWRAAYLPQVTAPGELPTTLAAWRTQQQRWNKGFAQVARKLLPSVWRSGLPPLFKLALTLEVGQSLFCPLAALCLTTSLSLLWLEAGQPLALSLLGLIATAMGVLSAITFVTLGQVALGRRPLSATPLSVLAAMTLTSGLILSNSRAVLEAAMGKQSPFVRTPKMGGTGLPAGPALARRAGVNGPTGIPEIVLGCCLFFTMVLREGWYSPLLGTTILGLAVVGGALLRERWQVLRTVAPANP
jgi:cellulose synthase/poly-beta-1,6-N-acetylglucosamine synthase-like glycosyltransferase